MQVEVDGFKTTRFVAVCELNVLPTRSGYHVYDDYKLTKL